MKNQNTSRFISSLIYIAMGLVLIIYPTVIGDTICYMLSGAAVVVGVLQIIGYAMTTVETRVLENNNGLAFGIILILLGVFICVKKELVISMIPFILGFMIALKGVTGLQNAVNLRRVGYGSLKGGLISSVIIMIFGVIMMMNPFSTAKVLSIMIGVGLLVSGAADLAANVMMTRMLKKMKED